MIDPICEEALDLIKHFEGLGDGDKIQPGLQPYQDHIGVWTLGYGSTYDLAGDRVAESTDTITIDEADTLLARDTLRAASAVDRLVLVPINDHQRGALSSFAYNLGAGALRSSTLLRRINGLDWDDVPTQFMRWVYAGGQKARGLERRRAAEVDLWGA